jgi:hypothetical protein
MNGEEVEIVALEQFRTKEGEKKRLVIRIRGDINYYDVDISDLQEVDEEAILDRIKQKVQEVKKAKEEEEQKEKQKKLKPEKLVGKKFKIV